MVSASAAWASTRSLTWTTPPDFTIMEEGTGVSGRA